MPLSVPTLMENASVGVETGSKRRGLSLLNVIRNLRRISRTEGPCAGSDVPLLGEHYRNFTLCWFSGPRR